ncbi:hypothetical protein RHSIM_Rhsim10G0041400 [Rhododendron simsii]|uniref:Leucine-rich repeat-containing N-terminal plant-type domain-containing protein n=1 Tax=Rhododendron simsii TaxID=118357 RepID=A0A834G9D2_RHOSS|nr:hypothetical protein RHSIM_Rhsim10G0041400 [Rhododendron simsii]
MCSASRLLGRLSFCCLNGEMHCVEVAWASLPNSFEFQRQQPWVPKMGKRDQKLHRGCAVAYRRVHSPAGADESSSSFSSSVEAKALLDSGWWGNFSLKNHCYLKGITCNGAGSVIRMDGYFCSPHGKLAKMNWSSLLNLEYLDLSNSRLTGEIPAEIASLSKLVHLDLSFNYDLQGVLPPTLGNLTQLVHLDLSATNIREIFEYSMKTGYRGPIASRAKCLED